jgi:carbon storage regulator CsrA
MLILGRKIGEAIVIEPGNIKVMVTGILAGGRVRLGIQAPRGVVVVREELLAKHGRLRAEVEKAERDRAERGDA